MRGINDLDVSLRVRWNSLQCVAYSLYYGLDECRMVEEWPQFVEFRRARANLALCPRDVLAILPAA